MRLAALILVALAAGAAAQDCGVELVDEAYGIHVVVESCSSIGSYSIGGLYDGGWERLTFHYPLPWRGTFTTFNANGTLYCTSRNPRDCTLMDEYSDGVSSGRDYVTASWTLPEAEVTQTHRVMENRTVIEYSIRNTDSVNHTVGVRLHIDTMLGLNDGAPIYLPGVGLKTTEAEYTGGQLTFGYWKAYNRPDHPSIVATGTLDPKQDMTYPVKVVVADWKRSKDTAWEYAPAELPVTGDSAVIIYYSMFLEPGQEDTISFGYGSEAPVLREEQGRVGLTEITLDRIRGLYCPGDTVQLKADVLSAGEDRSGTVRMEVYDGTVYYNVSEQSSFPADQVRTLTFNWPIPELEGDRAFTVKATLYNDSGVVGEIVREDAVRIQQSRCVSPVVKVGGDILKGSLLVAAVVAVGLLSTALAYLWYSRGSVEFTKHVDGEHVSVTVFNNTRRTIRDVLIEDTIPGDAEISVNTMNVLRTQNMLRWKVGSLAAGGEATLEYRIDGGNAVPDSVLRWDRGATRLK